MGWETLRGQDAAVGGLRGDLSSGQVAHAYLFFGPQGVGKATAASLLAQALQCEGSAPPCDACRACEKVKRGVHPDVITLRRAEDRQSIGTEAVREQVLRRAYLRPQEGRWQVFVIDDVQLVTVNALNALLKTLEEPPPDTVLILVTPNLHALPATVVSRCRRVRFNGLSRSDLTAILAEKQGGEEADLHRLVSLSMGRLDRVLGPEAADLAGRREAVLELLNGLAVPPGKADEAGLLSMAADLAGAGKTARQEVFQLLEMLRGLFRDIIILQVAPGDLEPWSVDVEEELSEVGRSWGLSGLIRALEKVESAGRDVSAGNTNPALTLEELIIALRSTVAAGV